MTTAASKATPAAAKKTAAAPPKAAPTGAQSTGPTTASSAQQHLSKLSDADVLTPTGMYEFLEALRAVSTTLAFYVEAAGTTLDLSMRRGTRDSADGRLTMQQKIEMRQALRRVRRGMGNARDDLLATARDSALAYSHMEAFLESLEWSTTDRPHRSSRGGFDPFAGR